MQLAFSETFSTLLQKRSSATPNRIPPQYHSKALHLVHKTGLTAAMMRCCGDTVLSYRDLRNRRLCNTGPYTTQYYLIQSYPSVLWRTWDSHRSLQPTFREQGSELGESRMQAQHASVTVTSVSPMRNKVNPNSVKSMQPKRLRIYCCAHRCAKGQLFIGMVGRTGIAT